MGTQFSRQCVSRREVVATTQQQQLQQQQHQIVYSFVIIFVRNHWIWWWEKERESNGAAVVYRTQSELNATTNTFLLLLLIYCYAHQEYFFTFPLLFSQTGFFESMKNSSLLTNIRKFCLKFQLYGLHQKYYNCKHNRAARLHVFVLREPTNIFHSFLHCCWVGKFATQ